MISTRSTALALTALSLALAGCSTGRFEPARTAPPPLVSAPSGTVSSGQLPPPTTPSGQFPDAPGAPTAPVDMAAAAANASDISAASVGGVWNVNMSGQSCRVATPQTKFGQGFRAGPLRCPAPLDGVKSWNVQGKQLTFYDDNGQSIAQLFSTGGSQFSGQTSTGTPISLSR